MGAIELKPHIPLCTPEQLNRIARQQGLNVAIAQSWVLDQICHGVQLDPEREQQLIEQFLLHHMGNTSAASQDQFLNQHGWNAEDLSIAATQAEKLALFKRLAFGSELEIQFLDQKLQLDQVEYSLIRVSDEGLAFELHQRLLEGEANFAALAETYSEGPERQSGGRFGPDPLNQAHPEVANKLRISQPGQLWPPFFLVNIWVILQLDQLHPARLDSQQRTQLLDGLFSEWMQQRVAQLLRGETPAPLPAHWLSETA
jgi:parvulin-like peptidyl-prolyl isomerase